MIDCQQESQYHISWQVSLLPQEMIAQDDSEETPPHRQMHYKQNTCRQKGLTDGILYLLNGEELLPPISFGNV